MDIEPRTEKALAELAELKNVSIDTLLHDFASNETRQLHELAEDNQRLANARENGGIPHKEMKAHLNTLRNKARARL